MQPFISFFKGEDESFDDIKNMNQQQRALQCQKLQIVSLNPKLYYINRLNAERRWGSPVKKMSQNNCVISVERE
jgi:hypothetical protein